MIKKTPKKPTISLADLEWQRKGRRTTCCLRKILAPCLFLHSLLPFCVFSATGSRPRGWSHRTYSGCLEERFLRARVRSPNQASSHHTGKDVINIVFFYTLIHFHVSTLRYQFWFLINGTFWLGSTTWNIWVPNPRSEPRPSAWKADVLSTRPPSQT